MKQILVIDDDKPFRLALMATLRRRGYEVLGAEDGAGGLVQAFNHRPSLILSDVNMAGKNGFEVLKELRTRPETSTIPVIIMTGEPQKADARFSMAHGADDYLPKPFAMEDMLAAVHARLERQEGITQFIESKHQAELLDTEEKLRLQTSALDAAANGIVITHRDGRILWVNPAFSKLTGFASIEVIGRNPAILNSGQHPPEFYKNLWQTVMAGEVWHGELINKRKDGSFYDEEMTITPVCDTDGKIKNFIAVKQDVSKRKRAEEESQRKTAFLEAQLNSSIDGILVVDEHGKKTLQNQRMTDLLKIPQSIARDPDDKQQLNWVMQAVKKPEQFIEKVLYLNSHRDEISRDEIELKDGTILDRYSAPMTGRDGKHFGRMWTFRDITERKRTELERQMMELELRQAHKLESIGQLAAGIAHEINTPTQYVGDNTRFVKDSFAAISKILRSHETLLAAATTGAVTPELIAESEQILREGDWEYLCAQIPAALDETLEGVERVSKIVRAMKEFSHPGGKEKITADLNKAIEGTATVARNEWKYVADLKLELEPNLPFVPCFLGEFNQAILNLIVNAAHAIGDVVKTTPGSKGLIVLQTRRDGDHVEVRVTDTGTGIPEAARPKIFEPFFTTKEVGKGTGQGLAMIYGSIVKRHGGTVSFETEPGKGTTFIIRLPLKPLLTTEGKISAPL